MFHLVNVSIGSNRDQSCDFVTDRAGTVLLWQLARGFATANGNSQVQVGATACGAPIDPRTGLVLDGGTALRIVPARRIPQDLSPDDRTVVVASLDERSESRR